MSTVLSSCRFSFLGDFAGVFANLFSFGLRDAGFCAANLAFCVGLPPFLFWFACVIAGLRTFFLGNVVEYTEKKMGIHWKQRVTDILMTSYKNKGIALALCAATLGPEIPMAMVAIATSIIVDVCWVAFMDGVLFSKKRMIRELSAEGEDISDLI